LGQIVGDRWMVERDSSSFLEPDVYLFGQFVIERGKMTAFVLQLEVYEDDVWYPIIRYDTSHGEAHIDYINPGGREYHKVWLGVNAPFDDIYITALEDIKLSYRAHIARWHRQKGRRR
jgi:hypothetical protein